MAVAEAEAVDVLVAVARGGHASSQLARCCSAKLRTWEDMGADR